MVEAKPLFWKLFFLLFMVRIHLPTLKVMDFHMVNTFEIM